MNNARVFERNGRYIYYLLIANTKENDARQPNVLIETETGKEFSIEAFDRGFIAGIEIENAELIAGQSIQPSEDTLIIQDSSKLEVLKVIENECECFCSSTFQVLTT